MTFSRFGGWSMGVSGALVWCVTNDAWIPFRLDAVKLSGTITKAHWESVAELIRLLASNQLVLRAGASSDSFTSSVPASAVASLNGDADEDYDDTDDTNEDKEQRKNGGSDSSSTESGADATAAASILTLLEDAAAGTANRERERGQNSGHDGGNSGDAAAETAAKCAPTAPTATQGKVLPAAFGRFYACNLDDGHNVLSFDGGDRAKRIMAATNMEAITFNVTTKSLDSLLSSIQQRQSSCKSTTSPPESVRSDPSAAKRSSPIILSVSSPSSTSASSSTPSTPTLSPSSSTSSLFDEQQMRRTTSRRHSVALIEPLLESSEDENSSQCTASSDESRRGGARPKCGEPQPSERAAADSYVPQETPTWLKLLQRYHDSKRLEKQIQRQREAWARNKRNLRRESVPKCVSGLSR